MSDEPAYSEQQLAAMSDGEYAALTARLRAPDTAERFRQIAASLIPDDQLDSFMEIANPAAFVTNGQIDEARVRENLGAFFGSPEQSTPRNWGQTSAPGGPSQRPGDQARTALEKRHGIKRDTDRPGADSRIHPGQSAREALAKRHGGKK